MVHKGKSSIYSGKFTKKSIKALWYTVAYSVGIGMPNTTGSSCSYQNGCSYMMGTPREQALQGTRT